MNETEGSGRVGVCDSDVEGLFDGEDDVFDLRHAVVLQDLGVRHGDVDARHPGGRSVQVVEGRTCKHTQGRSYGFIQAQVDISNCWVFFTSVPFLSMLV